MNWYYIEVSRSCLISVACESISGVVRVHR